MPFFWMVLFIAVNLAAFFLFKKLLFPGRGELSGAIKYSRTSWMWWSYSGEMFEDIKTKLKLVTFIVLMGGVICLSGIVIPGF